MVDLCSNVLLFVRALGCAELFFQMGFICVSLYLSIEKVR